MNDHWQLATPMTMPYCRQCTDHMGGLVPHLGGIHDDLSEEIQVELPPRPQLETA